MFHGVPRASNGQRSRRSAGRTTSACSPRALGPLPQTVQNGVLVSEAGVGAAELIRSSRIFVEEAGTRMGLALVNANASVASITFLLRNAAGAEIGRLFPCWSA